MVNAESIDSFHEALSLLTTVDQELRERAYACRLLGLTNLADDLMTAANDVKAARDSVRTAYGSACYQAAKVADQASVNMLAAALAMAFPKEATAP